MNDDYKLVNGEGSHEDLIEGHDVYEETIGEEQIIYCDEDFDGDPGTIFQGEEEEEEEKVEPADVPCYVMEGSYFTQESIDAANQDHSVCYFCKEDLKNKRFYVHLFDHHGFTKQQCEVMKQHKRLENHKGNSGVCELHSLHKKIKSLHSCVNCGMEFITKTGLNNHLKKDNTPCGRILANEENGPGANNIVCPVYGCTSRWTTYLELAVHVDCAHRDLVCPSEIFMIRRKTFPDKATFLKWKKEMEKETTSEFFLRTSQKVNFAVRTLLYKCLCSNSRGQTKRACEQCPAFIKCCQRNHGQFEVVACFGHLGHEHPTETPKAIEFRHLANQERSNVRICFVDNRFKVIIFFQYPNRVRIPNQVINRRQHVDQYGNSTHSNGMMILMPGEVEEEDEFSQVIVDDDDIVGPSDPKTSVSERQVYMSSSHHYPRSSHY
ncbi:hypothetical protein CRE_04435 [Caenorhabditis remanei]|uniref:C2H2-type domain-containing protein n=1 Tax=Caenorhabditis remanei TaxID=31234 RepID=E3NQZ5_CAERE|nr:hypothetical protein CRE_04435 [Caenorhabditis remanei]